MDLKALSIFLSIDPSALLSARDRLWRTSLHIVAERTVEAACFYKKPILTSHIETVAQMGFDVHAKSGLGWTVLDHYMHKLGWYLDPHKGVNYRPSNPASILNGIKYLVGSGLACRESTAHRLDPLDVAVLFKPHLRSPDFPAQPFGPDFSFQALKDSKILIDAFKQSSIKFMLDHGSDLSNGRALRTAVRHGKLWSLLFLLFAGADVNNRALSRSPLGYAIHTGLVGDSGPVTSSIIHQGLSLSA